MFCFSNPRVRLQGYLIDIATYSPLATTTVENSHGKHQNDLYKFRGKSKGPAAAAECSILSSLVCEHAYLKGMVLDNTMPSRWGLATMQKRLGRKKGHQSQLSRKARVIQAANKGKRRLCAWDIFRTQRMQASGKLSSACYKQAMKRWAAEWKRLSQEEKNGYQLDAQYQQACRDELSTRGLATLRSKPDCSGDPPTVPPEEQATGMLERIAGAPASFQTF